MFYMFQFVLRVSPSVIVDDLMVSFHGDASSIGSLSAIAMYCYSFCQIPSGVFADKFGVRRVVLVSLVLCILGTVLFASAQDIALAKVGRVILGAGSSAAFLCLGKIASVYFSQARRATLFGFAMSAGTIGALGGGAPLSFLVGRVGWRESLFIISSVGLLIFALNFVFLKAQSIDEVKELSQDSLLDVVMRVMKNKFVWLNALIALGVYLPVAVLADLWGPMFLIQKFQIEKQVAAKIVSLMYVGLFIGSLTLSYASDRFKKRKQITIASTLSISLLLSVLIYFPALSIGAVSIVLFMIGFFAGCEMLCFTGACESAEASLAGTVTGFVNAVVMLSGAFIQDQVGRLLDFFWDGKFISGGIKLYSEQCFQSALVILPLAAGASFLFSIFLKEFSLSQRGEILSEESLTVY